MFNTYFLDYLKLFPSTNDSLGIEKHNHLKQYFENYISKKHINEQKKFYKYYLELLNHSNNSLNKKILKYNIEKSLEYLKYDFNLLPLNHNDSVIAFFVEMSSGNSLYQFEDEIDYLFFIEKTKYFCKFLETSITNMELGIKKGVVLPKKICKLLIDQIEEIMFKKSYFKSNVPKSLPNYNKIIENILLPKLQNLLVFLKKKYYKNCHNKLGLCNIPNGRSMYCFLVKYHTTLDNLKIENIHNYGISETNRIFNLMIDIKDEYNSDLSIHEFNNILNNDPKLKFKNQNEVLKYYKKMQTNIYNEVFKKKFNTKISHNYLIEPVPKFNENFAPSAYYMPGDLSGKRKGTFYLNMKNINDLSKLEVESLSLHEGLPGHHLQLTYLNDNNFKLFLKTIDFTAYEEGWALYCESLGKYNDLLSYYGRLNAEILRSLRLIIDTGIHYYNWSFEKCFDYFKKYTFMTDDEIESEIYRYVAIPGQALAYKIGERAFLDIKKKKNMDQKKFHDYILKKGPMPLSLLN